MTAVIVLGAALIAIGYFYIIGVLTIWQTIIQCAVIVTLGLVKKGWKNI